jgi:hypothetical protein
MMAFEVERETGDLSHLENMIEEGRADESEENAPGENGENEAVDGADHDGFWAQMDPQELLRLEILESTGRIKRLTPAQQLRVSLREKLFESGVVKPREDADAM